MAKSKIDVWTHNFAKNADIRQMVKEVIIPKIRAVRTDREQQESKWLRFYNMWNVIHDETHLYNGRAKLYVPEVRKSVEAQARQLVDSAFPNDDYVACYPGMGGTRKGAEIQKAIRMWQIQQAKLPLAFHVFARQQCLYGTSVAYVCWNKKVEYAFKSARDPKTGKIKPSRELVELFNGPDFMVRDMFKWYALNPRKQSIDEDGCIDLQVLNRNDLTEKDKAGYLYGAKTLLQGGSDAYALEELNKDIERAENLGLPVDQNAAYAGTATLSEDDDNPQGGTYLLATVYAKVICPEACLEGEDPDLAIPMKIEVYNNEHVGFVGRNPFFHQRPPFIVGSYIPPNPDEFYGQGIPDATQYMQYEMNSKAEQSMDSVTYSLNPIAFLDPAMAAQGAEFEIEPGAKWFVNPQGVRFAAMPDVSVAGYNAIQTLRSQIQDYSDRTPSLPPQLSGKARTATQAELVNQVISVDLRFFQRQNELKVLQPLMEMWESLTDQNAEEDQMIMILGPQSTDWRRMVVSRNQMLGSYIYNWRVSTQLQNKQVQARQMLDAIKVASIMPPELVQKLNLNLAEMYRVLWVDLMGLPNADRILGKEGGPVSQDPETILKMIELGMEVEVLPGDDDRAIISFLDGAVKEIKDKSTKLEVVRQITLHAQQLKAKVQAMQRMQEQQQAQARLMALQLQQGGGGAKPAPQTGGPAASGNRTQMNANANAGDQGSGIRG